MLNLKPFSYNLFFFEPLILVENICGFWSMIHNTLNVLFKTILESYVKLFIFVLLTKDRFFLLHAYLLSWFGNIFQTFIYLVFTLEKKFSQNHEIIWKVWNKHVTQPNGKNLDDYNDNTCVICLCKTIIWCRSYGIWLQTMSYC